MASMGAGGCANGHPSEEQRYYSNRATPVCLKCRRENRRRGDRRVPVPTQDTLELAQTVAERTRVEQLSAAQLAVQMQFSPRHIVRLRALARQRKWLGTWNPNRQRWSP